MSEVKSELHPLPHTLTFHFDHKFVPFSRVIRLRKVCNFHPLTVVCRGSETQLQVDENVTTTTYRFSILRG